MRRWAVVVLLLVLSGCGPERAFNVGTNEYPVDILLGAGETPAPERPTPRRDPTPLGFPGFVQPPPPRPSPGVPPLPRPEVSGACPEASPLAPVALAAPVRASAPPVEASYMFRNDGFVEVDGAERVEFPETSTRVVENVEQAGEDWLFDVSSEVGGPVTGTTYLVRNSGREPGVYIVRVVSGGDVFEPQPEILLFPFPPPEEGTNLEDETAMAAGPEYRSAGTDPATRTTMALEARAVARDRIDACGEWIQAWRVEVVSGRIVSPGKDLRFTGTVHVATQFGGIVVSDEIELTGRDGLENITSRNRAVISRVPDAS